MSDSSADRDPLDRLAEDFVGRFRKGERPSLTEYAERLPERADEIRDLLVGNDHDISALQLDSGGRRVFTLGMSMEYAQGRRLGIKVWDLESGRELITVPLPTNEYSSDPRGADSQFWIKNEKLRVLTPEGIREFDGTPMPEKK